MKRDKLVPKRRFEEFKSNEAWELRKLGEITESFSGGTPSVGNSQYYGGTIPFIRSGEISSDKTELFVTEAGLNNSSAKMVKIGDVLYALYGATSGEVSISRINGAINQAILAIRSTRNDDHYFIGQWLRMQKEKIISTYLQGGQGNLSGSIVKELMIALPADKREQKLISSFLSNLDNLITLHQRKLKKLKDTKLAYLSEMFPKDGEKYPKRRFAGFTNPWELRKLKEVAEIVGGGTPSTGNPEYWDGDIDWYSPTEIGNQIYAKGSTKKITQLGLEKSSAKILPQDKTVLFTSRAGIGDMAILQHPGSTNQGFQSLVLKEGIDTYFIYSMGHLIKKYAEKNASGSTFLEISGKTLGEMPIPIPSINEQTQIGSFFKGIDKLITLHQRKLEKLEDIKKAYLNEMFV